MAIKCMVIVTLPLSTKVDELKEQMRLHNLTLKSKKIHKKKVSAKLVSFKFIVKADWKHIENFSRYYVKKGFEVSLKGIN